MNQIIYKDLRELLMKLKVLQSNIETSVKDIEAYLRQDVDQQYDETVDPDEYLKDWCDIMKDRGLQDNI